MRVDTYPDLAEYHILCSCSRTRLAGRSSEQSSSLSRPLSPSARLALCSVAPPRPARLTCRTRAVSAGSDDEEGGWAQPCMTSGLSISKREGGPDSRASELVQQLPEVVHYLSSLPQHGRILLLPLHLIFLFWDLFRDIKVPASIWLAWRPWMTFVRHLALSRRLCPPPTRGRHDCVESSTKHVASVHCDVEYALASDE